MTVGMMSDGAPSPLARLVAANATAHLSGDSVYARVTGTLFGSGMNIVGTGLTVKDARTDLARRLDRMAAEKIDKAAGRSDVTA